MATESLLATLGADTERAVRQIEEGALAEAQRIRTEADARVRRRCDAALATQEAELRTASDAQRATARRETRERILQVRNAFLERVFAAVTARLPSILESPSRAAALQRLVQEAVGYFPSTPAVVRCRRALADRLNGTGPLLGAVSVVPDESVPEGVVVEAVDGSLAVDNTLIGRLRWLRPALSIELVSRFESES